MGEPGLTSMPISQAMAQLVFLPFPGPVFPDSADMLQTVLQACAAITPGADLAKDRQSRSAKPLKKSKDVSKRSLC